MFPCILGDTTGSRHMLPTGCMRRWEMHSPSLLGPHWRTHRTVISRGDGASGHRLRPLSLPMHGARDIRHQELLGASEITGTYVFIPSKTTGSLRGYYPEFLGELAVHSWRVFGGKVVGSNLTRIDAATVWRFLRGGVCCWSNLYLLSVKPSEGPPLWAEFETETSPRSPTSLLTVFTRPESWIFSGSWVGWLYIVRVQSLLIH